MKWPVSETSDEKKVRSTTFWYAVLMGFIVTWMAGAYVFLVKKPNAETNPVVVLDVVSSLNTNFFHPLPIPTVSKFESRSKYEIGDVVVVRYFYVEAVVIDVPSIGDKYTLMYKNHEHTLEVITLPRNMLIYPIDGVSPVSQLVD